MATKAIDTILAPATPHMVGDGFRVHNFFPSGHNIGKHRMSPFFLMDYNAKFNFPPSDVPRGVGVHPHRGFETVTIAYQGSVAHHDSAGHSGVIGQGDVQWMTAGSGVLHKEYHEAEYSKRGGLFQMVQLWVNLPARFKMTTPGYQGIAHDQMGVFQLPDGEGIVEVVAGDFLGVKGPATTFSPIQLYNLRLKKGANLKFNLPSNYNTGILVVEGGVKINSRDHAPEDQFVLFKNEGEEISLEAESDSVLLVLSGEPINEPIAAYGPFLMNSQDEIIEAVNDFNTGKFGYLEE